MYKLKKIKKKFNNYLYDHERAKETLTLFKLIIITIVSSFLFTFGFNSFTNPNFTAIANGGVDISNVYIRQLASCGASGISQSILTILKICNLQWLAVEKNANIAYWIFYLSINIPLLILGWFKIGKRFAFLTFLNVFAATVFGILLKSEDPNFITNQISKIFITQPLSRAVFAGIFTGVASGLAYMIESSAGGADVLSYYISEKKSILVGKYSLIINLCIITLFSLLSIIPLKPPFEQGSVAIYSAISIFLCTVCYMIVVTFTVDKINIQNKKVQVQIITSKQNLSESIIAALPHSCTILNGIGGYSLDNKIVLYISVRKKELNKLIKICKNEDKYAFLNVIPLENVYGKFFRKPIR